MSKKSLRRRLLDLISLASLAVLLVACGGEVESPATAASSGGEASTAPAAVSASPEELMKTAGVPLPGSPDNPNGWTTVLPELPPGYPLPEPITISVSRPTDGEVTFPAGDGLDNNAWTRMISALFGINFETKWTWSDEDEVAQKYNLAMAANDLPDIMQDPPRDAIVNMVEADMLLEVGPIWDQYAHPKWKAAVEAMGEAAWKDVIIDGKRYGIPRIAMAAQDDTILWIRQDWLDELGLEAPTTLDELHDVAKAFVDANLGPGSETVGVVASSSFRNTWYGSLDPIWGAYDISTNWGQFGWSEAPDGSLRYDGIRPEAKEALALLNQWYTEGLFRKDFFAIGSSDAIADVSAGNAGLHFTPIWGANRDAVANDGAVWAFYDIPAGPAGQHKYSSIPVDGSFVVAKDFPYAKEWIEMTNWRIEMEEAVDNRMHGWEGMDYLIEDGEYVYQDMNYTFWTVGPLGTRYGGFSDPQAANNTLKYRLENWSQIPEEARDAYQTFFFADPVNVLRNEAQVFIGEKTVEQGLIDKYQGPETPTMLTNWADLLAMESETFLSIITGEKSIDAFDEFVANWEAGGGDQITAEVNEWWQAQTP